MTKSNRNEGKYSNHYSMVICIWRLCVKFKVITFGGEGREGGELPCTADEVLTVRGVWPGH